MQNSLRNHLLILLVCGAGLASVSSVAGVGEKPYPGALQARSLAASCANCHSTSSASGIPSLKGLSQVLIEAKMHAFQKSGEKSVMSQLAKGYTVEQITAIAKYYAEHSSASE